jgi:hypothetical protein
VKQATGRKKQVLRCAQDDNFEGRFPFENGNKKSAALLGFGCGCGRLRLRVCGQGIDDLAGTGVMEFFASLVFDRASVVLQAVDVTEEAVVFALQVLHLELEGARVFAFVLVGGEAVVAEDDVIAHENSKDGRSDGCRFSARAVSAGLHPANGGR